jgi:hypothetical protein
LISDIEIYIFIDIFLAEFWEGKRGFNIFQNKSAADLFLFLFLKIFIENIIEIVIFICYFYEEKIFI